MAVVPVILCGGPGSRLWPASTAEQPKPFLDLIGGRSLFQRTVLRMTSLQDAAPPLVVTGSAHAQQAKRQLLDLGALGQILAEPVGRDSAPALVAAALWIARHSPDALVISVASDHHIPDDEAFAAAVEAARPAATQGAIVTFGVRPNRPATGFGYIRPGALNGGAPGVSAVESFIEKPDLETAVTLVSSGCLWNSGNFMFRADAMVAEARAHVPALVEAVERSLPDANGADVLALAPCFASAERISIDHAVMERTSRAAVVPIDYAWSDLGSWDAVWEASPRDTSGNAVVGDATLADTRDSLIRAEEGARVVALGLRKVAVVARGKNVLVSDLGATGLIKAALAPAPDGKASRIASGGDPGHWSRHFEEWLTHRALPAWWCFGADHESGGFHEALSPRFAPLDLPRRARVQARQVIVYANAGTAGWQGPWRAAVRHGLEAMERDFRRSDGLYRFAVAGPGKPAVDDDAPLYEQAFVLLALAAVTEAGGTVDAAPAEQAARLAATIRDAFAHRGGGFSADLRGSVFLSDPLMHLFEASLAWLRIGDEGPWKDLAGEIFDLFASRLFNSEEGLVYEAYDAHWRPSQDASEDRIEPGHQFEWAWLLSQWARIGGEPKATDMARRLYLTGKRGISPSSGLVVDALNDDLSVARASSRLWPQTEWLRAAASLETDPVARDREVCAAAAAIERYLLPSGLWRDAPANGAVEDDHPATASSFYHIVGAIAALRALRGDNAE